MVPTTPGKPPATPGSEILGGETVGSADQAAPEARQPTSRPPSRSLEDSKPSPRTSRFPIASTQSPKETHHGEHHFAFSSTYIRKEDLTQPVRVTIDRVAVEKVSGDDGGESKPVVYFQGREKGLVLNRVNAELIVVATGETDTDRWPGREIELYSDSSIMFKGRVVGGVRVRPVTPATAPPPASATNGDVPRAESQQPSTPTPQPRHHDMSESDFVDHLRNQSF